MPTATRSDPKLLTLREHATLHARAREVTDPLFLSNPFFDPRDALQVKYEMLRRVKSEGLTVAQAARAFGLSRPSFYQAAEDFERAGMLGLLPHKKGPRRAHKLSAPVIAFILRTMRERPSLRASQILPLVRRRFGIVVHPRSIERAVQRAEKKPR